MSKVTPFLGAALSALAISCTIQVRAQDAVPYKDVKSTHWAYDAVVRLQAKGILVGYPDHYFRGQETRTRYEFAVAIDRILSQILKDAAAGRAVAPGTPGPDGKNGNNGVDGKDGSPGIPPEEVADLKRLANEFKAELARLGTNMKAVNDRLDSLATQVAAINRRLDKMIQFGGSLFTGFRVDKSRNGFADYSGAGRGPNNSLVGNVTSVQDLHLNGRANLNGGVKANFDVAFSNYLSYRGGQDALSADSFATPNTNRLAQTFVYEANLVIPIGAVGANTQLKIGRFREQNTPLTFWKPDYDAYFNLPTYDDGTYVQDGFDISSKFGSATTKLFAGSFSSVTSNLGTINRPNVGANTNTDFRQGKPIGFDNNGAISANQVAGVHIGVPLLKYGELGLSLVDFSQSGGATNGNPGYGNVVVYGANVKLNAIGRLNISGEASKSVLQNDIQNGVPNVSNDDNNAFTANVGYNSGPIKTTVGYQYIDPKFSAPGYWNKIGNWYNPTNVAGPFARVDYDFSKKIGLNVGADFLEGARNRPGFTKGTNIFRALGGVKYHLSKQFDLSADYEGVFYSLSAASSVSGRRSKPIEQYLTFGAGVNLAGNTVLKLAYQILTVTDAGGGFGGANSNASSLTTQVAVHF